MLPLKQLINVRVQVVDTKNDQISERAGLKITLLLTGSLTVMAGAVVNAAIPNIKVFFGDHQHAELFSKLIVTLPSLFIALVAPFAGKLIDRSGRKLVLLWSLLFYAIGGTSGLYLSNIYLLLLGRAVLGISVAGIMTINTTLIGDYFSGKMRSRFMGWQGAFMGFGGVFFVASGGILADISWRWPFAVYAVSLVLLGLAYKYLYEPQIISKPLGKRLQGKPQLKSKKYLLLYLTAFFGMLFFYLIPTQVPFLLQMSGVEKNSTIGYSISIAVLAGAIVSVNYGKIRMRLNFYRIYVLTFALMGTGYVMTAFLAGYAGALSGLIVAGFGTGMLMPNTNLWLISLAPAERRGRMVGLLNLAVYSGQFLSPIVISPVISLRSLDFAFLVCGIIMLVMAVYFYVLHHRSVK
jgi:MFS family permease